MVEQALALWVGWPSKSGGPSCSFLAHLNLVGSAASPVRLGVAILSLLGPDRAGFGWGGKIEVGLGAIVDVCSYRIAFRSPMEVCRYSLELAVRECGGQGEESHRNTKERGGGLEDLQL